MPAGAGSELDEHLEIAMVTTGDLRDLRGAVEALCEQVACDALLELKPSAQPGMDEEAAAQMLLNAEPIGTIGQISDDVLKYYSVDRPIAAARLRMDVLKSCANLERTYTTVARFPAVRRDLSLIVEEQTTWAQIQEVIAGVAQPLRTDVQYVTTYRGKPIPNGKKSVTLTAVYQSTEATLRSEQVDEQISAIVKTLAETLRAEVRT